MNYHYTAHTRWFFKPLVILAFIIGSKRLEDLACRKGVEMIRTCVPADGLGDTP